MSERVLHEWRFAGYVCRIVETEPGIVHFEQAQGPPIGREQIGPLAFNRTEKPMGDANEIIHLSQALAEASVINRDLSKAIQGWQEDRNRRESELAHLTARVAELEAENAKLRKCVEAADDFVETVVIIETSQAMLRVYSVALAHGAPYNGMDWSKQLSTYRAARAEVDK